MTLDDLINLNTLSGEEPGYQGDPNFYEPYEPVIDPATDPNTNPNDGTTDSPYPSGSVFKNQTPIDTGGLGNLIKSLFSDSKGNLDILKLGALGGGVAGLLGGNKSSSTPSGYQGSIPKYTATRNMVTAPTAGRRPGAGGTRYGGDVTFTPRSSPTAAPAPTSATGEAGTTTPGGGTTTGGIAGGGSGSKMVAKDDPFYQSPEYKEFQKNSEGGVGTMDMYESPYFGSVGSGSLGRAMDEAYKKYKGQTAPITGGYEHGTYTGTNRGRPQDLFKIIENAGQRPADAGPGRDEGSLVDIPNFTQPKGLTPDSPFSMQDIEKLGVSAAHNMASGGIAGLASGRYLQGGTDGMADEIPAQIGEDQPAALSHGEFVIPADVVSHLGNGNSDAGAQKLYQMMDRIREARTGTKEQGKQINPDSFMPGGLAKAYAAGGTVQRFNTGGISGVGTAANAGVTGTESNLSNWVGPYVTDMLGKGQALSEMPYQEYGGPLTAGASPLQQQAFGTAANLSVPGSIGTAAQTAGDIAGKAQGMSYTPTQFTNQFNAPAAGTATNFTNQFQAPGQYQNTAFTSGTFGGDQAQQYMNPYLQTSLNPQLAEARRQSDITEQQNRAAMTKAGAFGGGRQAILTAEGQRNLGTNLANITGKGYDTAYQNAMAQYNADQARNMQAQQASEQSKQFGAGQSMTAAQMMAQYGLSAQQAQEAARQFQQNQAMTGAQQGAQYGQAAQTAAEQSRQFGSQQGLAGLNTALSAAKTQGDLGISSADLGLRQLQQQAGLGAVERGIESEGIAADKAAFEEARANPYKMVQFQQSLLSGLPLAAQSINTAQPSTFANTLTGAGSVASLLNNLGLGKTPATPVPKI